MDRLFVQRLNDQKTFNYFAMWGLPAVETSLDAPLRKAFDQFQAKWIKSGRTDAPMFAAYARNDPLTMCTTPAAKADVRKVKEDTSAVYTVTYKLGIDGAIGQYYKAVSTVTLTNSGGQWLISDVSNALYEGKTVQTFTFPGRLAQLAKLIDRSR